jgi:uncharacterized protein (TIGR02444 family)
MAAHYALPSEPVPPGVRMNSKSYWNYSLAAYDIDRVRQITLRLQDDYGCDVNMLLFCCWLASRGQRLDDEQLLALQRAGAQWRSQCVIPLRNIRRFAGQQGDVEPLYQQLKAVELSAELQHQQYLLQCAEAFIRPAGGDPEGLAGDSLRAYCRLLSGVEWSELAEDIAELLVLLKL